MSENLPALRLSIRSTFCPKIWLKSEEAFHKYNVNWCCMVNARSEAYPCRQHNPSRLSEPNQWPVAGKPVLQPWKYLANRENYAVTMATNWSDVTYLKTIPVSNFIRKWCGSPGSVTVTRTILCDEGCRLGNNHISYFRDCSVSINLEKAL